MKKKMIALLTATAEAKPAKAQAGKGQEVKNVIVMVADGWGENQILATNYYNSGKAKTQSYQKFPTSLYMSTYSMGPESKSFEYLNTPGSYDPLKAWTDGAYINMLPTYSSAAGTAISTGIKTYDNAIGVNVNKESIPHIAEFFEEEGRATGVVSSVQFFHATPAAFVAHDINRNNYNSIAHDMIYESATDVVMAPGHVAFNDDNEATEPSFKAWNQMRNGERLYDGETMWTELTEGSAGGDANGDGVDDEWIFIETREEFEALAEGVEEPDRVFGIPQVASTLQQGRSGDDMAEPYEVALNDNVPTLATMTAAALNVLDNNDEGLFLMVEGGAIDWAGHANQMGRTIEEMDDVNAAVDEVIDWVEENSNWGETLLIVTGDHATGYLSGSEDMELTPVVNNGKGNLPGHTFHSTDHTNQLIPIYAKGQGANLLKKRADEKDPVRGAYLDNTELYPVILDLLK